MGYQGSLVATDAREGVEMPKILDDRLAGIDSGAPVGSEELARE